MNATTADQLALDIFKIIDSMNAAAFAHAFTENGTFRFGNQPPVTGRPQIEQHLTGFFAMIGGLRHEITGVWSGRWEGGEVKSVETAVRYTRKDGTLTEVLPAMSTLRLRGGLIEDYRIFVDASPLFA
jgi:hypothetical protein